MSESSGLSPFPSSSPPPAIEPPTQQTQESESSALSSHGQEIDIQRPFPPINAEEAILQPYERYRDSVVDFDTQVAERMMDLLINLRAWAEARPQIEDARGENDVRERLETVQAREATQEETRRKVVGFISAVRAAIASLTG